MHPKRPELLIFMTYRGTWKTKKQDFSLPLQYSTVISTIAGKKTCVVLKNHWTLL